MSNEEKKLTNGTVFKFLEKTGITVIQFMKTFIEAKNILREKFKEKADKAYQEKAIKAMNEWLGPINIVHGESGFYRLFVPGLTSDELIQIAQKLIDDEWKGIVYDSFEKILTKLPEEFEEIFRSSANDLKNYAKNEITDSQSDNRIPF